MARLRSRKLPGEQLPPIFECTVRGPPVSAQSRNPKLLARWKDNVAKAAHRANPAGCLPADRQLTVILSEFSEAATMDRDNMAKAVLDSLQGVAYVNDRQVKHVDVEWCDIEGSFVVRYMSAVVAQALSAGDEFLWIRVFDHVPRKDLR